MATANGSVPASWTAYIDGLLWGVEWATATDPITYYLRTQTFISDAPETASAQGALQSWSKVTNVTFTARNDTGADLWAYKPAAAEIGGANIPGIFAPPDTAIFPLSRGTGDFNAQGADRSFSDMRGGGTGGGGAGSDNVSLGGDSVTTAVPEFIPGDPNFGAQWHLNNTLYPGIDLNVTAVWDDYRGSGVVVGVIDDGIDYNHPDLNANYRFDLDQDFRNGDFDAYPSAPGDAHGTAVAGVIAAAANGTGSVGVAPGADITGFRVGFGAVGTMEMFEDALSAMSSVDIVNNSWEFGGYFSDNFNDPALAGARDAILDAVTSGRGGLGTVITFSAGNGYAQGQNVNYHNHQNSQYTIAVAAIDSDGAIAGYSTPGAAVLVSAPGTEILTTDRVGSAGYSAGDSVTVSGTSFSAPAVAGVVALMLEANPLLGYRDVQEILAYSARNPLSSESGWQTNGAVNYNGGGLTVSDNYGFGLVDAHAAVRLAETWTDQSTIANLASVTASSSPGAAINDFTTITDSINFSTGLQIEQIEIALNLTHTWIGDLVVNLTSPDGTTSVLVDNPGFGGVGQNNINFTLSSVQYWGETGIGNWTLSVTDNQGLDTGTLNSWQLTLYGEFIDQNDTYIFTDEWGRYGGQAGRQTITDATGVDTLNFAAVTADLVLDLTAGAGSSLFGFPITIGASTVIENAYGGDGSDSITGNSVANVLYGMRGNDTLLGGGGDDALFGGAGDDILDGGAGNDTLAGGAGDDTYVVDSVSDQVSEDSGGGTDLVQSSVSFTLGANIENLTLTGGADLSGTGNALANRIIGNSGANTLDGGGGGDILAGGGGDDTYLVDSVSDQVSENSGEGTDLVQSSVNFTLGANLENLTLTGGADLSGTGNALANWMTGNSGNNALSGGGGNDTLIGGGGGDILDGGAGRDRADYSSSAAGITISLAAGVAFGGDAEGDTLTNIENLTGSAFADTLTGDSGANSISGGAGNDTIDGGGGGDIMIGGAGDDTFYVDSTSDLVIEGVDGGTDTVISSAAITLGANIENLILTGNAGVSATGNAADNTISSNSGANAIDGGGGYDTVSYSASGAAVSIDLSAGRAFGGDARGDTLTGIDGVIGSAFADLLAGDAAANTLRGGAGDDRLYGKGGDDTLDGGDGNDRLIGGAGNDTLIGGAGNDFLMGRSGDDTMNAGTGNDTLAGDAGDDTMSGGDGDDVLFGGAGNDTLDGDGGNDRIKAGEGNDTVDGGAGTDALTYASTTDGVVVNLSASSVNVTITDGAGGTNVAVAAGSAIDAVTLGNRTAGVEHIDTDTITGIETIIGGGGGDSIFGGAGAETFYGGAGADYLAGGGGNDRLIGHEGDDTIFGDGGDDTLAGGAGNDEIHGGDGDDVIAGNENDDTLYGDAGADILYGGSGNDEIHGGDGADRLVGHAGDDTLYGDGAQDLLFGGAGNDTLFGGDANDFMAGGDGNDTIWGEAGNDTAFGDAGDDILHGGDGFDRLNGGDGADQLFGGSEKDWLFGGNGNDVIWGDAGDDILAGNAGIDTLNGGADNDTLFGDSGDDTLNGGAGDDRLKGGAGNDTLDGGTGSDTVAYNDATASVTVDLAAGTGGDGASVGTDLLTNIENIQGSKHADTLTGDGGANEIEGGGGGDAIDGAGGADTASYAGSAAAVTVSLLAGTASGGDAAGDTLTSIENLRGSAFADTLTGDGGANVLTGGGGADTLTGGNASDTFRYTAVTDSGIGVGDVIADFDASDGAEDIFLDGLLSGTFNFLGASSNAFNATGNTEARFDDASDLLAIDVDGDGAADMEITLTGVDLADLDSTDFTVT